MNMLWFVEATSALDLESEAKMYEILESVDVTYISVGHRPSLLRFHDKKLVLPGPGLDVSMTPIVTNDTIDVSVLVSASPNSH